MPTYLVERYLPGRDRDWLEAALARLPKETLGVAYLGSFTSPRTNRASADSRRPTRRASGRPTNSQGCRSHGS